MPKKKKNDNNKNIKQPEIEIDEQQKAMSLLMCEGKDCRGINFRLMLDGTATCEFCGKRYAYNRLFNAWVKIISHKEAKRISEKLIRKNKKNRPIAEPASIIVKKLTYLLIAN